MNKEIITHESKKWLWTYLETEEEVQEVVSYLKDNDLHIEAQRNDHTNSYDVWLEHTNLSGNGYFFNGKALLNHVRFYRRAIEISKTEEYLKWREMFSLYNGVMEYVERSEPRYMDYEAVKKYYAAK